MLWLETGAFMNAGNQDLYGGTICCYFSGYCAETVTVYSVDMVLT